MNESPRRRRLEPDEPKRGLPIFPLILLVVFAGLLLGALLARVLNHGNPPPTAASPLPSITPIPVAQATPTLAPRATPHAKESPSESPSPSPTAKTTSKPSAAASASPTAAPTQSPTSAPTVIFITPTPKSPAAKASAKPSAAPRATPTPLPPTPTATPTPVLTTGAATSDHAAAIVRSYLGALIRGQQATATGYLERGIPNENFLTSDARITDVQTTKNADGTYKVTADISSETGQYYETFKLEPGPNGLQITDHFAIKVQ